MTRARTRLAVDIGGRFADVVVEHAGGRVTAKVPTTAADPASGFMAGVEEVLAVAGLAPPGRST
jgi:N-methylhydantoinase A/oxoprolinase/acetone carboxylase beta subunit